MFFERDNRLLDIRRQYQLDAVGNLGQLSQEDFDKDLVKRVSEFRKEAAAEGAKGYIGGAGRVLSDVLRRRYDKERQKYLKQELDDFAKGERLKEDQLLNDLGEQGRATQTALDSQLGRLLEDTGISANAARSQVGGGFAERGLGRSSFAQQGVEDVSEAEIQQKAQIRSDITAQKQQVSDIERQAREQITEGRRLGEFQAKFEELKMIDQKRFAREQQLIQQQFADAMASQQRRASSRMFSDQLMAGAIGSAATLALGFG